MNARLDAAFDLDGLLTEEEIGWARKARAFATTRIAPGLVSITTTSSASSTAT